MNICLFIRSSIVRLLMTWGMWISMGILAGCFHSPGPGTGESTYHGASKLMSSSENTEFENTEIASSEEAVDTESPIDDLVIRDAGKAKEILERVLDSQDKKLSAWAAVYIQLLQVNVDHNKVVHALQAGTSSEDVLLKALCWRWLAADSESLLPPINQLGDEPVARLFAWLAFSVRGIRPEPSLKGALSLGKAAQLNAEKLSLNTLLKRSAPYDNGALAVAIAFTNSRRMELATTIEGVTVPLSAGYRQQLFVLLHVPPMENEKEGSDPFAFKGTQLHKRLEGPMEGQPLEMLRKAVVRSSDTLQLAALRELASRAISPEAGDLASAAAAMDSDDSLIQLEAARTYLLLVSRATTE